MVGLPLIESKARISYRSQCVDCLKALQFTHPSIDKLSVVKEQGTERCSRTYLKTTTLSIGCDRVDNLDNSTTLKHPLCVEHYVPPMIAVVTDARWKDLGSRSLPHKRFLHNYAAEFLSCWLAASCPNLRFNRTINCPAELGVLCVSA